MLVEKLATRNISKILSLAPEVLRTEVATMRYKLDIKKDDIDQSLSPETIKASAVK